MRTIALLTILVVLPCAHAVTARAGSPSDERRQPVVEQAQQNVERWQQFQRDTNESLDRLRDQLVRSLNATETPSPSPEPSYDDSDDTD